VQSSSQIVTTNKPTLEFLQAGCPSCRSTNGVKEVKEKATRQPVVNYSLTVYMKSVKLNI